ncbi:MAG: hypothetical protein M3415_03435 [Actinomycetota bacterium]|nr:hypothetical protein [Actinomycetota bacterium]
MSLTSHGRAVRMCQALLAACDPLGHLRRGASPAAYESLAVSIVAALVAGGKVDLRAAHAVDAEAERRFIAAMDDWWAAYGRRTS